jgi:O-antigen biosynthesis protein WbqP
MFKRPLDIVVALGGLVFFALPLLVISLLIKTTSRGPILFWSERLGRNNVVFLMPKFRTMKVGAPLLATHLFKAPSEYLTPIGQFLRKTSMDELPQLWSILKGDMSVVGPRPALSNEEQLLQLRTQKNVHILKPGLTGLAQVNGRDDLTIEDKVSFDTQYLNHHNTWVDLKIILKTILIVLSKKGIHH